MENRIKDFIQISEGEKVALIDPEGKVCLRISKKVADNLNKQEIQERIYSMWKQEKEFAIQLEKKREPINTVYIMLTRKCNMNCDFCAINANEKIKIEKEINLEDIRNKVIPFFQENKPNRMILTGGEPLIKEDIVEIVKVLRAGLSCPIILQSNGLAITEELVDQLKGVDEINISTKHMFFSRETENNLIECIEICQQVGIKVVLSFIYEKTNEEDLYKLIDIAAKYDIGVIFNVITSVGRAKKNSEILTDIDQIEMNLKIAKYILRQEYENKKISNGFVYRIQVRNSCGGYGKIMAIFPEGDMYMCQCMENNEVCMGNILQDTPKTIKSNLSNMLKQEEIQRIFCVEHKRICNECSYRYICGGRCMAAETEFDYRCIFTKALLNYALFYYDVKSNRKRNLQKYVAYMESLIQEWK